MLIIRYRGSELCIVWRNAFDSPHHFCHLSKSSLIFGTFFGSKCRWLSLLLLKIYWDIVLNMIGWCTSWIMLRGVFRILSQGFVWVSSKAGGRCWRIWCKTSSSMHQLHFLDSLPMTLSPWTDSWQNICSLIHASGTYFHVLPLPLSQSLNIFLDQKHIVSQPNFLNP